MLITDLASLAMLCCALLCFVAPRPWSSMAPFNAMMATGPVTMADPCSCCQVSGRRCCGVSSLRNSLPYPCCCFYCCCAVGAGAVIAWHVIKADSGFELFSQEYVDDMITYLTAHQQTVRARRPRAMPYSLSSLFMYFQLAVASTCPPSCFLGMTVAWLLSSGWRLGPSY